MVMESRGCGNRRFIKQKFLPNPVGDTRYLTLAVRPPRETVFPPWQNATAYAVQTVVTDSGGLYYATAAGTSSAPTWQTTAA